MLKNLSTVTAILIGAVATLPTSSYALLNVKPITQPEVAPEKPKENRIICKGCNENESYVLNALQDEGILDKVAIATIMGNLRQESTFIPNICENGGRVPYHKCRSGGVGILQWTDALRYNGLGHFAKRYGGDPSSLETQVKYMFYEPDWKMIKDRMSRPGGTINDYMRLAYKWVRWGHKGPRETYARQYLNKFSYQSLDS